MLKTNRGFLKLLLFSFITLGIYSYYFIHKMAKEANLDDESTRRVGGLIAYILLSMITLGIYSWIWNYRVCEKFANAVRRGGKSPRIIGSGWLLWTLLGSLIVIGPLVALVKEIHSWNDANAVYNAEHFPAQA